MGDHFSQKTREDLAKQAAYECVMPHCCIPTHFMKEDFTGMTSVSNAAHASGASGGKGAIRYDDTLTPQQRKSANNGAHLCPNHAMLIDKDPKNYSIELILSWQRRAAERRQWHPGYPYRYVNFLEKDSQIEVSKFLRIAELFNLNVDQRYPYGLSFTNKDIAPAYQLLQSCKWILTFDNGGQESPKWKAGDDYHAQDPMAYEIQLHILRCLARMYAHLRDSQYFWEDDFGSRRFRRDITDEQIYYSVDLLSMYMLELKNNRIRLNKYMSPQNARLTNRY